MSLKPTLILSSGWFLKASLQSGHVDLCLVSQKRWMHSWQKLWPHARETGFLKISRQMTHENCSSDNIEAMFLMEDICNSVDYDVKKKKVCMIK